MLGQEKVFHPEDDEVWSLDQPPGGPLPEPFAGATDDDLLIILFTSGTTSAPKGVMHRIVSEFGNAVTFNTEMDFGPDHRFLHVWPMAYSSGYLNTLLSPFMAGGSVVLAGAFVAQTVLTFWNPVVAHAANTLWLSPTMMASLLRIDRDTAGIAWCRREVRTVCCGTAPLASKLKRDFEEKYGVEVLESYGLSELLLITANTPRYPRRESSVGRVLPGVELRFADDEEILVRTPFAMSGYFDLETMQPAPLEPGSWFPTGDLGRLDAEGNLFVTGRKKDLIIRGGLNISPRAVRDVLLEHPAVEDAAVLGLPHDFYGEEVVAALKLKPGHSLDAEQPSILQLCRARLNQASVPTRLVEVAQFPTGSTGKVLIRELKKLVEQMAAPSSHA
jgi:long-chain acyl-CoA synthetase